jgi:hypothetical protein
MQINFVCATIGRPTLLRQLWSLLPQLDESDHLTILCDGNDAWGRVSKIMKAVDVADLPLSTNIIVEPTPLGAWGHGIRTKYQNDLPGDYLHHFDDDDVYMPNAVETLKATAKPNRLNIYRVAWGNTVMWRPEPVNRQDPRRRLRVGNTGTQAFLAPNNGKLPPWPPVYGGDGMHIIELAKQWQVEWHTDVIYKIRDCDYKPINKKGWI